MHTTYCKETADRHLHITYPWGANFAIPLNVGNSHPYVTVQRGLLLSGRV